MNNFNDSLNIHFGTTSKHYFGIPSWRRWSRAENRRTPFQLERTYKKETITIKCDKMKSIVIRFRVSIWQRQARKTTHHKLSEKLKPKLYAKKPLPQKFVTRKNHQKVIAHNIVMKIYDLDINYMAINLFFYIGKM